TGNEPPLPIARVAVGESRGLAVLAHRTSLFLPFHDSIVRDVAPQQITTIAEPHWAFAPAKAMRDALDRGQLQSVLVEARIDDAHGRIGIARTGLPGNVLGVVSLHGLFLVRLSKWSCAPAACSALP